MRVGFSFQIVSLLILTLSCGWYSLACSLYYLFSYKCKQFKLHHFQESLLLSQITSICFSTIIASNDCSLLKRPEQRVQKLTLVAQVPQVRNPSFLPFTAKAQLKQQYEYDALYYGSKNGREQEVKVVNAKNRK